MERPFPAHQGDDPYAFVSDAREDHTIIALELQRLDDESQIACMASTIDFREGRVDGSTLCGRMT